jgi:hypothetical protein
MSRWNNDKAFRDNYKKRILPSVNERKLRCDVQIRDLEGNLDTENGNETVVKKAIEYKRFSTEEESDDFDIPVYEKLGKEEKEIDEETLKEKKREEQLEKARLAMERKRKLHEKAAAKAVIRVKKEAEKKRKELDKRAKKKKAVCKSSSVDVDRTTETVSEASKPEKEKLLNGRSVFPKQRSYNYRYHGKGNDAVLKAIIKRRKAYRLWVWTVSSAAVALPLALLVVFYYVR